MIDILGLGTPRSQYPNVDDDNFTTLDDYLELARKTIGRFAPKYRATLGREMLRNDDTVSYVATAIMVADWLWNKDYRSKTNTVRSQYAYRNQHAIWAIQRYITRQAESTYIESLDMPNKNDEPMYETVIDKRSDNPAITASNTNLLQHLYSTLDHAVEDGDMTRADVDMLVSYYSEQETLRSLAQKYHMSHEGVRQSVQKNLKKAQKILKTGR